MNLIRSLALTLVTLAAAQLPAAAQTLPSAEVGSITWLSADIEPTDSAKRSTGGLAHKMVSYMNSQWPQVKHTIVRANAKRSWQMISQGEHACHASAVRTPEREKLAYFTNTQLGPPLQVIARRDRLAALPRNAVGEVDLAKVLADERLLGALIDSRSYGLFVDELLARRPENKSVVMYSSADFGSKILPMLSMGRADYTVEYDIALSLLARREPRSTELISLPIQGASELVQAGVACPRTPWGLAAIRGIDQVLGTPAGAAMLSDSYFRWLSPELRQHYGARMALFYKERAKPSVIR